MNIRTAAPANTLDLDELVVVVATLGLLTDRIKENGHEVPETVKAEQKAVERELNDRLHDDKARRLKILESRLEGLLTNAEKRKNIEAEAAKLRKELGAAGKK